MYRQGCVLHFGDSLLELSMQNMSQMNFSWLAAHKETPTGVGVPGLLRLQGGWAALGMSLNGWNLTGWWT